MQGRWKHKKQSYEKAVEYRNVQQMNRDTNVDKINDAREYGRSSWGYPNRQERSGESITLVSSNKENEQIKKYELINIF